MIQIRELDSEIHVDVATGPKKTFGPIPGPIRPPPFDRGLLAGPTGVNHGSPGLAQTPEKPTRLHHMAPALGLAVARSCLGASSPPVGKPGARQSSNLAALQQPAALQTAALEVATPGSCRGIVFGIFSRGLLSVVPLLGRGFCRTSTGV